MTALRSSEKNTACFDFPRATNADCPENCSAIKKIPKKYRCIAGMPSCKSSGSLLNGRIKRCGKKKMSAHIIKVNMMENIVVSLMADFTLIGETVRAALEGRQLQPLLRT